MYFQEKVFKNDILLNVISFVRVKSNSKIKWKLITASVYETKTILITDGKPAWTMKMKLYM